MDLKAKEHVVLRGQILLHVVREGMRETYGGDNIMCTAGFTALVNAWVWSGIQDQAVELGVTSPTYLTPLWGAVGSGTGTAAKTDLTLFSELSRTTVGAGASSPATSSIAAQATWLFYFPSPSTAWSVTEAGLFAGGTSASGSGTLLDHYLFPSAVSVPTTDTSILEVSFGVGP